MATSIVNLDVTQYVKVNIAFTSIILEARRDAVRIVLSDTQPAVSNNAFHMLGGGDNPLKINIVDTNVWALSMSNKSSLVVTESSNLFPAALLNASDFILEVAKGNIPGHTTFEKFGKNDSISSGTVPEDVWNGAGLYTGFPLTGAETMEIFSSSALDTALGTGARTVQICNLLDSTGASVPDVTVTLNGVTPVSLGVGLYNRCSRMEVITAGSSQVNAGTLTLRHTTTTANIFAVMPIGASRTHILAYTVPLGFTLYMKMSVQMAMSNGSSGTANVTLRAIHAIANPASHTHVSAVITQSQSYPTIQPSYAVFTERTDIVVRVEAVSNNNTFVAGDFNGVLVDNTLTNLV